MEQKNINNMGVPVAIIIAGIIIAGAIFFRGEGLPIPNALDKTGSEVLLDNVRKISNDDHIRGSKSAPIKIVEYSDLECPFCKRFHDTMNQVIDEFGEDKVAWIFRHFPLDSLHQKARVEANALECAGKLGGNEAFWDYLDKLFETTPSNDGLDLSLLPTMAAELGLNKAAFEDCQDKNEFKDKIEADYQNATKSGGRGTPFPVIIVETRKNIDLESILPAQVVHSISSDGKTVALNGAIPFNSLKQMIEDILEVI